ncbi:Appr-1-p processing domain-containing protein [Trypanosoma theileri]|uniref:Appr-1-p processing domain-containing protein n=1 Tax=Trypanosoma theileri TaxID=67003 RepID=A0A1X0NSP6_9TRYP|nr:Appr-1-p processing domain-containing protein [Trypanosoma theileri]ORC87717.1 Appr-1-p processing domain-containing protein [Trypanosoma theileri]
MKDTSTLSNKRGRETEGSSLKFITYSLQGEKGEKGENHKSLSSPRARILATTLSPLEQAIFNIPIERWGSLDRTSLKGWRCAVPHPVSISDLPPVDKSDRILQRIAFYKGPVTDLQLDAIVNAANNKCLGGGGVDGAIHSAAGPLLLRECATFNGCATGQCRLTKGYQLPARYVLHTVGPIGEKPEELRSCYRSILSLARCNGLRSVGFCCVSTGVYGYPLLPATRIALTETLRFVAENTDAIDLCCFACFRDEEYNAYTSNVRDVLKNVLSNTPEK